MKLLMLCLLLNSAWGYNILAVFPVPARSHDRLGEGIVRALIKAGHEVTWVTPYPEYKLHADLTIIDVSELQEIDSGFDLQTIGSVNMMEFGRKVSEAAAGSRRVRRALQDNYDAVITELFLSDLHAGFAAVLQVPWLVLSVQSLHSEVELMAEVRGARRHPRYPNGLTQRAVDALFASVARFRHKSHLAECEKKYNEIFEPIAEARNIVLPSYSSAVHNISVLFVNSHPSFEPTMSMPLSVVNIGGYHTEDDDFPMPEDLQQLMDSSTSGVVYFSMGSVLQATGLPAHTRDGLLRTLGALPCTVLWKYETPLTEVPSNVHIRRWWPQPSVLAHPNTKLFITHGGLLSILEATKAGVPLLVVPVNADQPDNARHAERAGNALSVPYSPDMVDEFEAALNEMLNNNSYYSKAKFLSTVFNDRRLSPAKLIPRYVELAIRNKGASHLHPQTRQYAWYERYMADQLAVILITLWLVWVLLKFVIRRTLNLLFITKEPENTTVKKSLIHDV